MRPFSISQLKRGFLIAAGCFIAWAAQANNAGSITDGLSVRFNSANARDVAVSSNVWLYVPSSKSPTPFLPGEKFTAVWEGFLAVDLRGNYAFEAELNGALKLEVNGVVALDATGTNSSSGLGKSVRLSKGTNAFRATFSSPARGDAFVRLRWKSRDLFLQPIPSSAFSHAVTSEELAGNKLRLGRELAVENRCLKCHRSEIAGMPELEMDAPSFEGIGSRRNAAWMARWIEDPKKLRPTAHMPNIFSGPNARTDAEAVAAFLASLKSAAPESSETKATSGDSAAAEKLFATLHCTVCHNAPDAAKRDDTKIDLKLVRAKFAPGALVHFLKQPDLHYAWIRMPTFKLSDEQRRQLAACLITDSEPPGEFAASAAQIEKGKKLVQTSGCLNCHNLKLENRFSAKTLAQLTNKTAGCLAEKFDENTRAPQFGFSSEERAALRAFLETDRQSLSRHVPDEFATRQSRLLNCAECHNKIEGIPRFEILGGKLKPEWASKFIAGEVDYKPRPWVAAQMPAFSKPAALLAEGLAMQHGFPPQTSVEPPIDPKAAAIGRDLVSVPPHGFSCVTCHAVGAFGATQTFESPGINLAHTGERLLPSFFKRWLRSPSAVDPISKMPTYFAEDGQSPLTDVYNGDGEKQIDAIWQYIRLGEKMPAPKTE